MTTLLWKRYSVNVPPGFDGSGFGRLMSRLWVCVLRAYDMGRRTGGDGFDAAEKTLSYLPLHGPTSDAVGSATMKKNEYANLGHIGGCEPRTLLSWADEIGGEDAEFYRLRPQFVSDVGYVLMRMRKDAGLTRTGLCGATGLSRVTILEIESGQAEDGNSLAKIGSFLSGVRGTLAMTYERPDQSGGVIAFGGDDDARTFSAGLVRRFRQAAGLTQRQLNDRLRLPDAIHDKDFSVETFRSDKTDAAPMISRIEKGHQKRGIRLGTLFSIAFFCGFRLQVPIRPAVLQ